MEIDNSNDLFESEESIINDDISSKEDALLYVLKFMYDSEKDNSYYKYLLSLILNEIKNKDYEVEGDIVLSDIYYHDLIKENDKLADYINCNIECNSIDFGLKYFDNTTQEEKNVSFVSLPKEDSSSEDRNSMQLSVSSDNKLFYVNYDMSYFMPKVEFFSIELGEDKYREDAVVDYYHDIFLVDKDGRRREYKEGKKKMLSTFSEVFNLKSNKVDMGFNNIALSMLANNFYDYKNLLNDIKLGVYNSDYFKDYRIVSSIDDVDDFLNDYLEIDDLKKHATFIEELKINHKLSQIKKIISSCADCDSSIAIDRNLLEAFNDYIFSNDNNFYGIGKIITRDGDEYISHNIVFDGPNRRDYVLEFDNLNALDGFNYVNYDSEFNNEDNQIFLFFDKIHEVSKKKSK